MGTRGGAKKIAMADWWKNVRDFAQVCEDYDKDIRDLADAKFERDFKEVGRLSKLLHKRYDGKMLLYIYKGL